MSTLAAAVGRSARIDRIIERQMRNWEIAKSQTQRTQRTHPHVVENFVTISREVGAGGLELAAQLSARLKWPLFDKGILDTMAGDDMLRRRVYESMDERDLGWYEETLRSLLPNEFSRNDYFRQLCATVLSLARQGPGVFLGRGVDLILPRDHGFRVRIIAPYAMRVKHFAERANITLDDSKAEIDQLTRERHEFLAHHFRADPDAPDRNDLIINLATLTLEDAVELILLALRRRGLWTP